MHTSKVFGLRLLTCHPERSYQISMQGLTIPVFTTFLPTLSFINVLDLSSLIGQSYT